MNETDTQKMKTRQMVKEKELKIQDNIQDRMDEKMKELKKIQARIRKE